MFLGLHCGVNCRSTREANGERDDAADCHPCEEFGGVDDPVRGVQQSAAQHCDGGEDHHRPNLDAIAPIVALRSIADATEDYERNDQKNNQKNDGAHVGTSGILTPPFSPKFAKTQAQQCAFAGVLG